MNAKHYCAASIRGGRQVVRLFVRRPNLLARSVESEHTGIMAISRRLRTFLSPAFIMILFTLYSAVVSVRINMNE